MKHIPKIIMTVDEPKLNFNKEFNAVVFTPNAPTKDAVDLINIIGLEAFNAILLIEHIKKESNLEHAQQPHVFYQLIHGLLSALITKDPNHMHYDIINKAIEQTNPEYVENTSIRDQTAREFIKQIQKLKLNIHPPKDFEVIVTSITKGFNHESENHNIPVYQESLDIISLGFNDPEIEKSFESKNMFIWDQALLKNFENMGKFGTATSKNVTDKCKQQLQAFKEKQQNPLLRWFNTSDEKPFYLSDVLVTLAQVILKDTILPRENFARNNPSGITTNVQDPIVKMLSTRSKFQNNELLYDNRIVVGTIESPSSIMEQLSKGVAGFKSLTAIKLLRFFIQKCHDQVKSGYSEWRTIKFPGGAQEIAQCLGVKSNDEIKKIKEIINALDHFKFSGESITSRLISVGTCKPTSIFSKQPGYEITVLSPLLPYRIFEEDNGFIIPLLHEPTLFGHRSYHARLHLLQWKIAEEFVIQSRSLAQDGYIEISDQKLKELLHACDLPEKMLHQVKSTWTAKNDMLKEIAPSKYTLNRDEKALRFLEAGGIHRNIQSNRGKTSAKKRKKT